MRVHPSFCRSRIAAAMLVASLVVLGAPLACATTIGISMPVVDPFRTMLRNAIQSKADASGTTVRFVFVPAGDIAQQNKDIAGLIGAKVDALVVIPVDATSVDGITGAARKADVPLVFVNNGPRADWIPGRVALAIPNELVAGRLQMHILAERMGGKGTLAILTGPPTFTGAALRTAGVKEVIRNYPDIRIVEESAADWSRDKASALMAGWLKDGVHVDAVAANNDEMAIGAYDGWVAAGSKGTPPLIAGVDATKDGIAALHDHHLAVTVRQDAQLEGEMALNDAQGLIDHKPVPQYDWVPFTLVSKVP